MAIIHQEWLNRNSLRRFPLVENSLALSNRGLHLPDDLIVDATIVAPSAPSGIYLGAVCVTERIVSAVICSVDTNEAICSAVVNVSHEQYSAVRVDPVIEGVCGFICFGPGLSRERVSELLPWRGTNLFDSSNRFEERCLIETGAFPVRSLGPISSGSGMRGDVALIASGGTKLDVSASTDETGRPVTQVVVSIDAPEAFRSPCDKLQSGIQCSPPAILSINGVVPDQSGNITVEFIGFGEVAEQDNGVLLLVESDGKKNCVRPTMPDASGSLPE